MRAFCHELEQGRHHSQLSKYHQTVQAIATWYKESYQQYEKMLQTELGIQLMSDKLQENLDLGSFTDDLAGRKILCKRFSTKVKNGTGK